MISMGSLSCLDLERLAVETGFRRHQVVRLAGSSETLYDRREIQTDGKRRSLLVPAEPLKSFQGRFYRAFLRDHSYHEAVYCRRGRGAVAAADRHKRHAYLLHLDIADFFPSVSSSRVRAVLSGVGVEEDLATLLTRLLTVRDELPQGAPTSTAVGNLVLYRVDSRIGELCRQKGLTYTRYVDDLAVSGGHRLEGYEKTIRRIVADCGWSLNERGRLYGPDEDHRLLGVIADVHLTVGEEYLSDLRRVLGRARRCEIRLTTDALTQLQGRISWVSAVEPAKGRRLKLLLDAVVPAGG